MPVRTQTSLGAYLGGCADARHSPQIASDERAFAAITRAISTGTDGFWTLDRQFGSEEAWVPQRRSGPVSRTEEVSMAIGFGIFLIVVGAALVWAVEVDIQFIDDNALGWILMVAGIAAIVLSLVINAQRSRSTTRIDERRVDTRLDDRPPL
jgi:hypothetical protein